MSLKQLIPKKKLWMGSLVFGTGCFIILAATDIIPIDEEGLNAPRWVLAVCGFIFSTAGIMIFLGEKSKWNNLLASVLIFFMGSVGTWVALFGVSENFSGGIPLLSKSANTSVARFMFGSGAMICFVLALYVLVRHFKSEKK